MKPHPRTPEFQRKADAMHKPGVGKSSIVPPVTDEEREMLGLPEGLVWGKGEHIDLTPYIYPQVTLTLSVDTADTASRMELALAWRWIEQGVMLGIESALTEAILCVEAFDCGRDVGYSETTERELWDYYRDLTLQPREIEQPIREPDLEIQREWLRLTMPPEPTPDPQFPLGKATPGTGHFLWPLFNKGMTVEEIGKRLGIDASEAFAEYERTMKQAYKLIQIHPKKEDNDETES